MTAPPLAPQLLNSMLLSGFVRVKLGGSPFLLDMSFLRGTIPPAQRTLHLASGLLAVRLQAQKAVLTILPTPWVLPGPQSHFGFLIYSSLSLPWGSSAVAASSDQCPGDPLIIGLFLSVFPKARLSSPWWLMFNFSRFPHHLEDILCFETRWKPDSNTHSPLYSSCPLNEI